MKHLKWFERLAVLFYKRHRNVCDYENRFFASLVTKSKANEESTLEFGWYLAFLDDLKKAYELKEAYCEWFD